MLRENPLFVGLLAKLLENGLVIPQRANNHVRMDGKYHVRMDGKYHVPICPGSRRECRVCQKRGHRKCSTVSCRCPLHITRKTSPGLCIKPCLKCPASVEKDIDC